MADQHPDPSGNTEAFRAFVHTTEPATAAAAPSSKLPLIIGIAVAVVVLAVLVGWIALG